MKIYYFVAYYGPNKPYTYEKARYIAKYARHKNPGKRDYIHIDSFVSYREATT